jgi:hypothetical protein
VVNRFGALLSWPRALRRAVGGLIHNWSGIRLEGCLATGQVIVNFQNVTNHEVAVREVVLAAFRQQIPRDPTQPELWGPFTLGAQTRRSITYPIPEGIVCISVNVFLEGRAFTSLDVPPDCSK